MRLVKISHYRHKHTSYEKDLQKCIEELRIDVPEHLLKVVLNDIEKGNLATAKFRIFCMLKDEHGARSLPGELLQITNEEFKKILYYRLKKNELKQEANKKAKELISQDGP